jgi:hypothetical protein
MAFFTLCHFVCFFLEVAEDVCPRSHCKFSMSSMIQRWQSKTPRCITFTFLLPVQCAQLWHTPEKTVVDHLLKVN